MILHRPVPETAQVQNGRLIRKRVGDKFSYSVNLTVRVPENSTAPLKANAIGVDIGFRQSGKGTLRAAAIATSDPREEAQYIEVPETFVKRLEHIDSLKSQLDEKATKLGEELKPLLKKDTILPEDHPKYRFIKSIANMPSNVTLSFEKAYKLGRWIVKAGKGELPEEIERPAVRWWRANSRTYREIHNLRRKTFLDRKAFYRNIAAVLVKRNQPIGVEKINLSVFAETRDSDNPLGNTARLNRFLVSPSELLNAIRNAGQREGVPVIEVAAQNTSRTCHQCGEINNELGPDPVWTCTGCNIQHDRDHNAAINIARKAEEALKK
ncbi:MAG: transposase [Nitrospinaceae bacterium]|nr:transposase [Nitrospinaceae bacterium]NIR56464.1 transposase [Nitrospinaceae bacterium]NIS86925.1 transposase [Nitrospinaceae bacterium]NIU98126.1 transposase [Nitrospinaceae bacterium]NIW07533.1 transposase [Nitrospinaceae bacterium]